MDVSRLNIVSYNMVTVFQRFDISDALRDAIKNTLRSIVPDVAPLAIDLGSQLLVVAFPPPLLVSCQFGDRRISVEDKRTEITPGERTFCDIAARVVAVARAHGNDEPIAYGYNFELRVPFDQERRPVDFLREKFSDDVQRLGNALSGRVDDLGMVAKIVTDEAVIALQFETAADTPNALRVYCNYHIEPGIAPTEAEDLSRATHRVYQAIVNSLEAI